MLKNLDVYLWGERVGSLLSYKEKYDERICFYYDKSFLEKGWDIAPLWASTKGVRALKGLPIYAETDKLYGGLPSFIADSLPDDWGRRVFSEWSKVHGVRMKDISPLDRLAYMGSRAMGALEFRPPIASDFETPFKIVIKELYESANQIFNSAKTFKIDAIPDLLVESIFKVGTSAGGRRPKAVININPHTKECLSGQVNPPNSDYVPCIIKFDEHCGIPMAEIEYSYYLMSIDAGLNMMPCNILRGNNECHFITERFDRVNGEKIHTQTLAAMNPLAKSYEDLFSTANRIGIIPSELKQIFIAMTMNVMCGNVDDHSKNFSFIMYKDGVWHLSPIYDFSYTLDSSDAWYNNRHSLSINGKVDNITEDDLLQIAQSYNIKSAKSIINKCREVSLSYRKYARVAGVSDNWINTIEGKISNIISVFNEIEHKDKVRR